MIARTSMKITTFYATASGESRLRDITIPFDLEREDAFGHHIIFSESYASSNVHIALFPPSTISRKVSRNGGYDHYRATPAEARAWDCAHRPKPCKLASNRLLRQSVAAKLRLNWSPGANCRMA